MEKLRVAVVSDHVFSFNGAARVTKEIGGIFNNPDYFFLFGDRELAERELNSKNIYFSGLQRIPFLKSIYRYTYFLWPTFIESFDLSKYDLVISSSFSVAHGVVTGIDSRHISYIHTPMRYAWDLKSEYFNRKNFSFLKRLVIPIFLNYLRMWDVCASNRADMLVANSEFVSRRIRKYWGRSANMVIHPPVDLYAGKIKSKREEYFVIGNPFEPNKMGGFVFECAKELGFRLKVIGDGSAFKKMRRKYSKCSNIEFLGRVSEEEKYRVLSNAKGFVASGIEDFGIFPVEAMSCGTPVLAYRGGGYLESVAENLSGMFFDDHSLESFKSAYEEFCKREWNYVAISKRVALFNTDRFRREFKEYILKNI